MLSSPHLVASISSGIPNGKMVVGTNHQRHTPSHQERGKPLAGLMTANSLLNMGEKMGGGGLYQYQQHSPASTLSLNNRIENKPKPKNITQACIDAKESNPRHRETDNFSKTKWDKLEAIDHEIKDIDCKIDHLSKKQLELTKLKRSQSLFERELDTCIQGTNGVDDSDKSSSSPPLPLRIYTQNKKNAEMAHRMFSGQQRELPIYVQPSHCPVFKANQQKFAEMKPKLMECLCKRQQRLAKRDEEDAAEYDAAYTQWINKVESQRNSAKRRAKDAKNRDFFERIFPDLKRKREQDERISRMGNRGSGRSEFEIDEIASSLRQQELADNEMRRNAVIPPLVVTRDCAPKPVSYTDDNGFIKDPVALYKQSQSLSSWTPQQEKLFREKYLMHPKNFAAVSHSVGKSVEDCIKYYYLKKPTENYKKMLRTYSTMKKRTGKLKGPKFINSQAQQGSRPSTPSNQAGGTEDGDNNNCPPSTTNDSSPRASSPKSAADPTPSSADSATVSATASDSTAAPEDTAVPADRPEPCGTPSALTNGPSSEPSDCIDCRLLQSRVSHQNNAAEEKDKDSLPLCDKCSNSCGRQSSKYSCPVPLCNNPKNKQRKLKCLHYKWDQLSQHQKDLLLSELGIKEAVVRACASCYNRITQLLDSETSNDLPTSTSLSDDDASWTEEEETKLQAVLKVHGCDWEQLAAAIPTKTSEQCKKFFLFNSQRLQLDLCVQEWSKHKVANRRNRMGSYSNASREQANASDDTDILTDDGDSDGAGSVIAADPPNSRSQPESGGGGGAHTTNSQGSDAAASMSIPRSRLRVNTSIHDIITDGIERGVTAQESDISDTPVVSRVFEKQGGSAGKMDALGYMHSYIAKNSHIMNDNPQESHDHSKFNGAPSISIPNGYEQPKMRVEKTSPISPSRPGSNKGVPIAPPPLLHPKQMGGSSSSNHHMERKSPAISADYAAVVAAAQQQQQQLSSGSISQGIPMNYQFIPDLIHPERAAAAAAAAAAGALPQLTNGFSAAHLAELHKLYGGNKMGSLDGSITRGTPMESVHKNGNGIKNHSNSDLLAADFLTSQNLDPQKSKMRNSPSAPSRRPEQSVPQPPQQQLPPSSMPGLSAAAAAAAGLAMDPIAAYLIQQNPQLLNQQHLQQPLYYLPSSSKHPLLIPSNPSHVGGWTPSGINQQLAAAAAAAVSSPWHYPGSTNTVTSASHRPSHPAAFPSSQAAAAAAAAYSNAAAEFQRHTAAASPQHHPGTFTHIPGLDKDPMTLFRLQQEARNKISSGSANMYDFETLSKLVREEHNEKMYKEQQQNYENILAHHLAAAGKTPYDLSLLKNAHALSEQKSLAAQVASRAEAQPPPPKISRSDMQMAERPSLQRPPKMSPADMKEREHERKRTTSPVVYDQNQQAKKACLQSSPNSEQHISRTTFNDVLTSALKRTSDAAAAYPVGFSKSNCQTPPASSHNSSAPGNSSSPSAVTSSCSDARSGGGGGATSGGYQMQANFSDKHPTNHYRPPAMLKSSKKDSSSSSSDSHKRPSVHSKENRHLNQPLPDSSTEAAAAAAATKSSSLPSAGGNGGAAAAASSAPQHNSSSAVTPKT